MNSYSIIEKSPVRNGLVTERKCTDMFCAFVFPMFLFGFIGLAVYAFVVGKPERMISGVDGDHRVCGQLGSATADYP